MRDQMTVEKLSYYVAHMQERCIRNDATAARKKAMWADICFNLLYLWQDSAGEGSKTAAGFAGSDFLSCEPPCVYASGMLKKLISVNPRTKSEKDEKGEMEGLDR